MHSLDSGRALFRDPVDLRVFWSFKVCILISEDTWRHFSLSSFIIVYVFPLEKELGLLLLRSSCILLHLPSLEDIGMGDVEVGIVMSSGICAARQSGCETARCTPFLAWQTACYHYRYVTLTLRKLLWR